MSSLLQRCTRLIAYESKSYIYTCSALEAARKGTRMRRDALKKKNRKEEIKKVFIPYAKRLEMEKVGKVSPRTDDSHLPIATDDVYFTRFHRVHNYSVAEAVEMHRETAQPCQYNKPDGNVTASIELSLSADKKNKYLDGFSNILLLPHQYPVIHKRSIMAICKDEEMVAQINKLEMVDLAIGPQFKSMLEKGELDFKTYDFVVAHVSVLPHLVLFRNQLKKKMPSILDETASADLEPAITRFYNGIKYEAIKDKYDHDFGSVNVKLGSLTWDADHIEANLEAILHDIEKQRLDKVRSKRLITKVNITCEHTFEKFQINYTKYFDPEEVEDDDEIDIVSEAQ